jgi:hypothetical protein
MKQISITPGTSHAFASMSFFSACMIVGLHSMSCDGGGFVAKMIFRVLGALFATAIPWFFFAAGFFLCGHYGEEGWWLKEIKKRIRTLLVPFWIWSAIIFVFHVAIALVIHKVGYRYGGEDAMEWLSVSGIVRLVGLDLRETMPTMWFLRSLFVLVALSPIIIRYWYVVLILSLSAMQNSFMKKIGLGDWVWLFSSTGLLSARGFAYFSLGIAVRRGLTNWFGNLIGGRLQKLAPALAMMLIIVDLLFGSGLEWIVPPLMYIIYKICSRISFPQSLLGLSFPVYVIHMMIVFLISASYGILGIGGVGHISFMEGLVRWGLVLVLSLSFSRLICRFLPRFAAVAYGGTGRISKK